ncbi:AraC family transcriptional regulator [bacterium 1xD8-6]|nr:AraC family transcriptional regulator [bacterium D16-36]RKI63425.1 AraC family transcriptional regulator [bacterium 1xD8-6]
MKYFRSTQYPIEFVLSEHINKNFSSHNHAQHYIISLCIKGSASATLKNKSLLLKENDFFTVPPFMPHAVSLTDTSVLVSLCMDKSFVEDYSSQEGTDILEILLLSPKIQKRITKLQTELLLQAVSYVYELHDTHKEVNSPAAMENDMFILCDRLMNHFSDSLPLDSLARDLYISKYYLIRKCKKNFGLTPHKFHLQNRIRKAQTLLFTNKSVTEASMDTGFYDQSHFDRAFKNIVGISPTEYLASSKTL